jgi:CTP:molybdopterin cytidylyltransferase MocA
MGQPKALLCFAGETLLARILRTLAEVHVPGVVVGGDDVRGDVRGAPEGQLIDSIRAGLRARWCGQALWLWPVDAPFADAALLTRVLTLTGPAQIGVPAVGEQHGHPVLFGADVVPELWNARADEVVRRAPGRCVCVPAHDRRIVMPMNTPAEALALGIT